MRVLLSSHGAGPYGAERMLLALARGLASRGHHVVLDLPHEGPAVPLARSVDGVEVRVGRRPRLPRNAREGLRYFLGIPRTLLAVRRLVREVRPDITWVNSLFNPWAALAARSAGSRVVWHLHERNVRGPLGWLSTLVIALTAERAVAVSEYVASSYRRFPGAGRRLSVVLNPLLQPVQPVPLSDPKPFTVGYIGQLEPRKRASDLARAVAAVDGLQARFVGDGKARGDLEQTVREQRARDRVVLVGYMEDVRPEMERFHCLAIPSLREPFGLVALEAMAAGVPVIAARSGALPEVLGDAAVYHAPADPSDLAQVLEQLRDDPQLRALLRDRGLRRVTRFSYPRWLETVESFLDEDFLDDRPLNTEST